MPMFEDTMELAHSGELPPKEPSPPPRPSPPTERVSTPSKPISIPTSPYMSRRMSEESIRTELCEGPLPNTPSPLPRSFASRPSPASEAQYSSAEPLPPRTPPSRDTYEQVTDRAELIERIKRGESPTWIPNRHVSTAREPVTFPFFFFLLGYFQYLSYHLLTLSAARVYISYTVPHPESQAAISRHTNVNNAAPCG